MADENYKRLGCADCGVPIWKGSTRCIPCAKPPVLERACAGCKVMFKPKPGGNKGVYCSRECAFVSKAKTPFTPIYAGYCKSCEKPFVAKRENKYCSKKCERKSRVYVSTMPESKACSTCGKDFKPISKTCPGSYCSDECRDVSKKSQKRISRLARKARVKCATVERVDPFKVFDRDKWKCQLCGVKTPKSKRGTYSNDAPELDHIQPISKGGEHSYLNTHCTCRKCNAEKSDTPFGQMLMFG